MVYAGFMTETYPQENIPDPQLQRISNRIIELAEFGAPQPPHVVYYNHSDDGIRGVLTQFFRPETRKCSALFEYPDGTAYDICFDENKIWSLTHNDREYSTRPDRVLPFTNGLLRASYVSYRGQNAGDAAKEVLNVHEITSKATAEHPEVAAHSPNILDALAVAMRQREAGTHPLQNILDALDKEYLDINPADIDVPALCAPLFEIDPPRDLRA
jgi:hypothetical protein